MFIKRSFLVLRPWFLSGTRGRFFYVTGISLQHIQEWVTKHNEQTLIPRLHHPQLKLSSAKAMIWKTACKSNLQLFYCRFWGRKKVKSHFRTRRQPSEQKLFSNDELVLWEHVFSLFDISSAYFVSYLRISRPVSHHFRLLSDHSSAGVIITPALPTCGLIFHFDTCAFRGKGVPANKLV